MQQVEPMVRAQLLITPEQRRRLEQVAQREGRSLSDVTRRAIDAGLDALEGRGEAHAQERLAILAELNEMRLRDEREHGVYPGDIVAEVRAEREEELGRVWRNE